MTNTCCDLIEDDDRLIVVFHQTVRDRHWTESSGEFVAALNNAAAKQVVFDLSAVTWMDPLSLLHVCCTGANHALWHTSRLQVKLGAERAEAADNRFLLFLTTQGFATNILSFGVITFAEKQYNRGDGRAFRDAISRLPGALTYRSPDCILARLVRLDSSMPEQLEDIVEDAIDEAQSFGLSRWLPRNRTAQNLLEQKLRVVLLEALENVREHAYQTGGYAALYARIRHGLPQLPAQQGSWRRAYFSERLHSTSLKRSQAEKQPGWLELFVCDAGVGLTHYHSPDKGAPLAGLTSKLFRDDLSRETNRLSQGKTVVTGLQHIGNMLRSQTEDRGDFVRVYCNGEWLGEHFPWPELGQDAGHENIRSLTGARFPTGTWYHFIFEPRVFERFEEHRLFPRSFAIPTSTDLVGVRQRLTERISNVPGNTAFLDLQFTEDKKIRSRGRTFVPLLADLEGPTLVIRPSASARKIDLLDQVTTISEHLGGEIETLIYADLSPSLSIDFALVLASDRLRKKRAKPFEICIVTQDWLCAAFTARAEGFSFEPDRALARRFFNQIAPDLATILRLRDSELFWKSVRSEHVAAFINEPVAWRSSDRNDAFDIRGYLDLPTALADPTTAKIASQAMRRAVGAFGVSNVIAIDELVSEIVSELHQPTPERSQGSAAQVLASSLVMSGSTIGRYLTRRRLENPALACLVVHPDSGDVVDLVSALDWLPRSERQRTPARKYERIGRTPYVFRGGERAIPLPRFRDKMEGGKPVGYYGESPRAAYRRWQDHNVMRMGHWTYNEHHDLLTINVLDALLHDARDHGDIMRWLTTLIDSWRLEAKRDKKGFAIIYPRHRVTDRLAADLRTHYGEEGLPIFPITLSRRSALSPLINSPASRERLWRHMRSMFVGGGTVALLDDAVISGRTLSLLDEYARSTWALAKRTAERGALDVRSIAILDRTARPTQSNVVEAQIAANPRFWRWDVPTLGDEASCPLCKVLGQCRYDATKFASSAVKARIAEWSRIWGAIPIGASQPEDGLHGAKMMPEDVTRFGQLSDGTFERVHHQFSTSRSALAAEISTSTTRLDYAFEKASTGKSSSSTPLDNQTRIELLATQCLLFWYRLGENDRADRLDVLLDLIWLEHEVSPFTALAAIAVLNDRNLRGDVRTRLYKLIEEKGFPNDDALLVALLCYDASADQAERSSSNRSWTLLQALVQPDHGLRAGLIRLFCVVGWDEGSIHRSLLCDLLQEDNPSSQNLSQADLLMDLLRISITALPPELFYAGTPISPRDEGSHIRSASEAIRTSAGIAARSAQTGIGQAAFRAAAQMEKNPEDAKHRIKDALEAANALIFVGEASIGSRYLSALTVNISGQTLAYQLLERVKFDLLNNWDGIVRDLAKRGGAAHWVGEPFFAIFSPSERTVTRPILIYFDALVHRAARDLMSNVKHAIRQTRSPWAPDDSAEAYMWIRANVSDDETFIEIEMANDCSGLASVPTLRRNANLAHLLAIGGSYRPELRGDMMFTIVRIPTVPGLVGGADEIYDFSNR